MPYFTSADGIQLYYEIEGQGPPIVLHLGAGCDLELWRAAGYVETLARDRRCILFDHRGHGRSDRPQGSAAHQLDLYVADLVALIDHLGLDTADFWGYSNAVFAGLATADRHPGRLSRLIFSGGLAKATREQLAAATEARVKQLRETRWELMIAGFKKEEVREVPEWMTERIRATDIGQFIAWRQARPEWNWNEWDAMPRIKTPALFLVGELEDPEGVTAEAAALMPNASCVVLSGFGHINAFLRSDLALPHALHFLAAGARP
ncbi:MAG TPA: alpha/beta fold hydrolase [Candidatus Dormibacteraeota bacterium]|nr:alpha/beta fold hydrolase [Candidatus Dormibacteraeota bacterium]